DLSLNPELSTKIINFEKSKPISNCCFINTNITCYEENTCTEYNGINRSFTDDIRIFKENTVNFNYKLNFNICTKDEVNKVLNTMKKEEEIIKDIYKINENEIQSKYLSVNENSSANENKISNFKNIYSDNQHLPPFIESNDIFNYASNTDSVYSIQYDEKNDNMIDIINAEVVNSEPINYHDIINQLTNNINNNNIKHHSLPSYVEIINDNSNNDSNQNIDIKKENDNNNEKTLSTSEPQQININTTEEIDLYMEENLKIPTQIINDNGNNYSNQNIDIKKENDNNNEKTLSTSEPQQININTTEKIDLYMEENSKNVVNEDKPI
ncbi:hypothetical protein PIROE2DRAFT_19089, partial [Piromyces sp. E2]